MRQRFALVVVADPDRLVTTQDDHAFLDHNLIVGGPKGALKLRRLMDLTLVVAWRDGRRVMRVKAGSPPVTKNGVVVDVDAAVELGVGDEIGVKRLRLRYVEVDPVARLHERGAWWALTNQWYQRFVGPVWNGQRLGLLVSNLVVSDAVVGDVPPHPLAVAAGRAASLPAVVDAWRDGPWLHTVFDVGAGVGLEDFVAAAAPGSIALAARLGLDLLAGLAALQGIPRRHHRVRASVRFDGGVQFVAADVAFDDERAAAYAFEDGDAGVVVDVVADLVGEHVELAPLRALRAAGPLPVSAVEPVLRRMARGTPPATDNEVAAVVGGLFADDHRRAMLALEQLQLTTTATLRQRVRLA